MKPVQDSWARAAFALRCYLIQVITALSLLPLLIPYCSLSDLLYEQGV